MPYRKEKFENGDIAHIVLKGVDGNALFKNENDYFRIIFSTYEFNNAKPTEIRIRRRIRNQFKKSCGGRGSAAFPDERDQLVDLFCFAFMPNHMHLLVKQLRDDGIVKFMSKIGTGYGGYVIRKYKREGHVFQSAYTAVPIKTDEQLMTVVAYIHANPLSLKYPQWKEIRLDNPEEAIGYLEEYKWSSHPDHIGIQNFPSVTQRDFILELFGGVEKYKEFILNYIVQKGELKVAEARPPHIL